MRNTGVGAGAGRNLFTRKPPNVFVKLRCSGKTFSDTERAVHKPSTFGGGPVELRAARRRRCREDWTSDNGNDGNMKIAALRSQ